MGRKKTVGNFFYLDYSFAYMNCWFVVVVFVGRDEVKLVHSHS